MQSGASERRDASAGRDKHAERCIVETADPIAALSARDIPTRAAAARDLALVGTLNELDRLIGMAAHDPSPGVRLSCAAGAADILTRHRLSVDEIPRSVRESWLGLLSSSDPSVNAGLFQVAALLGLPEGVDRVFRGAKDPRADVRAGGCVGLLRLCQSAAVNGDRALEARVLALVTDPRVRSETRVEVGRLAASVGYVAVTPGLEGLLTLGGRQADLVTEALGWVAGLPPHSGVWADRGLDAGEVRLDAPIRALKVVGAGRVATLDLRGGTLQEIPLEGPIRVLWSRRGGGASKALLQVGRETWEAAEDAEIADAGERLVSAGSPDLLAALYGIWPDTAAGQRTRGATRLRLGDAEGALALLTAALEMKKVPVDTSWWLAECLHVLGRDEEARPHLEKFVARAPKKHPQLAEARARLG